MKKPSVTKRIRHAAWLTPLRPLSLLLVCLGLGATQSANAQSYTLTSLWSISPKTNTFFNNDNLTRGLAYNPVTDHVLVVSRSNIPDYGTNFSGTNGVYILNASGGEVVGKLAYDASLFAGGTYPINMIAVTDDGVIYAGNLTTDASNPALPYKLYRWADESAQPVSVYSGDPSNTDTNYAANRRFGDSIAVRGTGAGTQILLGTTHVNLALLTTTDGTNFTSTKIVGDAASGIAPGDFGKAVAWGTGNTFFAKQSGSSLKVLNLDLTAKLATVTGFGPLTAVTGGPLGVDTSRNLAAIVETAGHAFRLYNIYDPTMPIQLDTTKSFPTNGANGNSTGSAVVRNGKVFALESNNGIMAYALTDAAATAPTIATQPASVTLWEGASNYTFSVVVGGTQPFGYQWRVGGVNIPGATSRVLNLPNVSYAQAGAYSVVISNAVGSVTSSSATLAVTPANGSAQIANVWTAAAGTRPYLPFRPAAGDTALGYKTYGVAVNPLTTNVIVVTRPNPTNMLAVLDLQTGEHKHYMDYTGLGVTGMNKVDVADDGTVYVCNLTTSTNNKFTIYGFGNDGPSTTDKWKAYDGDPGNGQTWATNGWGQTFVVRGSGLDTEILIGHLNSAFRTFAILKPDAQYIFSSTLITVPDAPAGFCRLGLDWGPQPNTVWAKTTTGNGVLYLIEYDLTTGTGYVKYSYPTSTTTTALRAVPALLDGIKYDPTSGLLAGLRNVGSPAPVSVLVYEASNPDAAPFLTDQELLPTFNADIEFQGHVDFGAGYLVALGVNNGLTAYKVNTNFVSLPAIITHPASASAYVGTPTSFSVVADSTSGLGYQWYFGGQMIADATDSSYSITSAQTNQAGVYTVRVSNNGGYRESGPATLTVIKPYETEQMTNIWSLIPGSRPYLNAGYNEYGMAFNPATSNLLVVSVVGGSPMIGVLDAVTGADKYTMDVSALSGTTKLLHKIDVADDGVVYAGNLTTTAGTSPFKVYRWDNDASTTVATVAFEGDPATTVSPNKACGYTFDVRGAGVNTEILVGMGAYGATTNTVSILKTTDGMNFVANEIKVTNAPAGFSRLGLCFNVGNTFWAKAWQSEAVALGKLYLVQYDLATKIGTVLKTYPTTQISSTITTLAYNDNLKLLAGIATDTQKNVMMYNVADLEVGPALRDQELFPSYNSSIEANGDLDFGGNAYLFALNENNGIMAFQVNANYAPPSTAFKVLSVKSAAGAVTLVWEARSGAKYQVQQASTVNGSWQNLGAEVTAAGTTASYVDTTPDGLQRFYRVLAK